MTQFFQVLKPLYWSGLSEFRFYDDSILSGTKTKLHPEKRAGKFYDDSILSGTKTYSPIHLPFPPFYDDSILSGTKTSYQASYNPS